jgi:hypothetical protein
MYMASGFMNTSVLAKPSRSRMTQPRLNIGLITSTSFVTSVKAGAQTWQEMVFVKVKIRR